MSRSAVRIFRSSETLPTRRYDITDENPPLFVKAGHWASPYPYTMKNRVQQTKQPATYPLLGIENEYLRVTVCPKIGGHLWRAVDRATGEDLFHRKGEMLPGRFSVTGAWIPVGIEYNFPVSHSAVTLEPLRSEVRRNPDGSASIFTTDQCLISRMVWLCETRIRPGSAVIENRLTAYNPSPWPHRYYYWLNACVDASDTTRIVLPTRRWTHHGKGAELPWPVFDGADHSYVRNIPNTTGVFARDCREDFYGVYDPQKGPDGMGVLHVADYRVVPGKKLFTWGNNHRAKAWDVVLSDKGVPYLELQTGLLEEQGDYGFLKPYESLSWRHVFVPVRGLGETCARANERAAVGVVIDRAAGRVEGRLNVFAPAPGVTATLRVGDRVIGRKTADAVPQTALVVGGRLPASVSRGDVLTVELADRDGAVLLRHEEPLNPRSAADSERGSWLEPAVNGNGRARPSAAKAGFSRGLFLERVGRHVQAERTYQAVLEKSPDHLETLLRQASLLNRHGRYAEALDCAERIIRLDFEQTEGHMQRGMALWRLGRTAEAEDAFWVGHRIGAAPRFAAYHAAVLAAARGDRERSIELLQLALADQPLHPRARALAAMQLAATGRAKEATALLNEGLRRLPCDVVLGLALWRIAGGEPLAAGVCGWIELSPDAIVEAATADIDAGLLAEAAAKVRLAMGRVAALRKNPVLHYLNAWLCEQLGDARGARKSLAAARSAGHRRIFPARLELLAILQWAVAQDGRDGIAHVLLARLAYSLGRCEEALGHWRAAIRLLPPAVEVVRSYAFALWEHTRSAAQAAPALRRALALAPHDLGLVVHLDHALTEAGRHAARLPLLRKYRREAPGNDGVAERMMYLHVQRGEYRQAYDLLMGRRWGNVHGSWVRQYAFELCSRFIADDLEKAGRLEEAIEWHRKCATEPESLGMDPRAPHEHAEVHYRVGRLLAKLGRTEEAAAEFAKGAASIVKDVQDERNYYVALCLQRVGRRAEARGRLQAMERKIDKSLRNGHGDAGYTWFRHALALDGLGRHKLAAQHRRKGVEQGFDECRTLLGGPAFGFI